jgi:REP element-mobilizing transposase RayT
LTHPPNSCQERGIRVRWGLRPCPGVLHFVSTGGAGGSACPETPIFNPMVLTCSSLGACGAPCLAVPTPVAIPVPGTRLWPKDRALDQYSSGPLWLRHPQIADVVAHAIAIGQDERQFYELCAWVVMPNHVHLLILPTVAVATSMRWLKGSTARRANQILGRTGRPFWQDDSYDHYLRDPNRISRTTAYIEQNPVCAGLARSAEDWPWSSAGWQAKPPAPPNPPDHQDKM